MFQSPNTQLILDCSGLEHKFWHKRQDRGSEASALVGELLCVSFWPLLLSFPVDSLLSKPRSDKSSQEKIYASTHFIILWFMWKINKASVWNKPSELNRFLKKQKKQKKAWTYKPIKQLVFEALRFISVSSRGHAFKEIKSLMFTSSSTFKSSV